MASVVASLLFTTVSIRGCYAKCALIPDLGAPLLGKLNDGWLVGCVINEAIVL